MGVIEVAIGPGRAIWTNRHGGVSAPPYDTANLSSRGNDDPDAVRENRLRVAATCGLPAPEAWWWLQQEHGCTTVAADGVAPLEAPVADAAVTTSVDIPLVILTADCAPIALATDDAIAAVHAGWAGLIAGVIDEAVARLRAVGRGDVQAVLGPCIHPERYEFGRDDLDRVIAHLGPEVEGRTDDGKPALDLPTAVRRSLFAAGVEAFDDVDVCTSASADYFSHRRDGETGRQALVMICER
jgi:YfiH family protein